MDDLPLPARPAGSLRRPTLPAPHSRRRAAYAEAAQKGRRIRGRLDLLQAFGRLRRLLRQAQHVERHNPAEDVERITQKIFPIVERRGVPPQPIPNLQQPGGERIRLLDPVILDIEDGTATRERPLGAEHHIELHAFDVYLDELDLGKLELVEGHHLDLLAALAPDRDTAEIAAAAVVDRRDFRAARAAPDRMRQGADIVELIEGDVAAQNLEDDTLRLECVDEAGGADELRHRKRMRTEIGADIKRHVARLKALAKQIDLAFGIFAILVEGAAHIGILAQIRHGAVAALPDRKPRIAGRPRVADL